MKTLFDPACVDELKQRLRRLHPDSPRQWGQMQPAQMLAHCTAGLQMALGEIRPPRAFIGRLFGRAIKRVALRDEELMRRNSPTARELLVPPAGALAAERDRLSARIDQFAAAGPSACTGHPHPFFGPLTPQEWSILMYKHLDHHLRQFGA